MTDSNRESETATAIAVADQEEPKLEELTSSDHENFFAEQDKKFEEMHRKLQELKIQNKNHMDTIINSLDQLIADKNQIEHTLDQIGEQRKALEELENLGIMGDAPVIPFDKPLRINELLAKVTGLDEEEREESEREKKRKPARRNREEKMDTVGIGQNGEDEAPLLDKEELLKDLNLSAPAEPAEAAKDAVENTAENTVEDATENTAEDAVGK